ncbi:MAG: hypothetical protein MJ197_03540 [Bacteroidales bacterium]|nr:hypothetical protein [Bacteroidales bacterium]
MAQYIVKININAESATEVKNLGNGIQNAVNNIAHEDLQKLLNAVAKNPSLVKTALKFI